MSISISFANLMRALLATVAALDTRRLAVDNGLVEMLQASIPSAILPGSKYALILHETSFGHA